MTMRRNILLTPGPATTSARVKQAQIVPDICPREMEFGRLQDHIARRLVEVVHGEETHSAVLFAGSGTLAVEACISSLVHPADKILVLVNGAYGARILDMCHIHLDAGQIVIDETSHDEAPDMRRIEAILAADPQITHLAAVHHETTTGALVAIDALADLAKRFGIILIVDAMSSYGGIPIDLRETACDVLISSSNKCIQGMPGISFAICRNALLVPPDGYRPRSLYLDLYAQHAGFRNTLQMRFTPPVQVLYALDAALEEFFTETQEARSRRYNRCWSTLVSGMTALGFRLAVPHLDQSRLLTTFLTPNRPGFSFESLHDTLLDLGFTIYPGKVGRLDSFRLANIGDIDVEDIKAFLVAVRHYLDSRGIDLVDRDGPDQYPVDGAFTQPFTEQAGSTAST